MISLVTLALIATATANRAVASGDVLVVADGSRTPVPKPEVTPTPNFGPPVATDAPVPTFVPDQPTVTIAPVTSTPAVPVPVTPNAPTFTVIPVPAPHTSGGSSLSFRLFVAVLFITIACGIAGSAYFFLIRRPSTSLVDGHSNNNSAYNLV